MDSWRDKGLERVAYHEAGHAVVAHALGYTISGISVATGSSAVSFTWATPPGKLVAFLRSMVDVGGIDGTTVAVAGERLEEETRNVTAIYAAGAAAVQLFKGQPHTYGSGDDFRRIHDLAEIAVGGPGVDDFTRRAMAMAADILRDRRIAVQALAKTLMDRQRLDGTEPERIITEALASTG